MKKLIVFFPILLCISVYAQFKISFPLTQNQQMIENTVVDGFFMVRQEYQLEDTLTGKKYSLDNRPYFGCAESLMILTETGYYTRQQVLQPWAADANYKKYNESGTYRPVLSRTMIRTVRDSVWRITTLLAPISTTPLKDSTWVMAQDTLSRNGFSQIGSEGEQEGWLVWLTSTKEDDCDFIIYRQKFNVEGQMSVSPPATGNKFYGSVFLIPDYDKIGTIRFRIAGIVLPCKESWELYPVILSNEQDNNRKQTETSDTELTPVTEMKIINSSFASEK